MWGSWGVVLRDFQTTSMDIPGRSGAATVVWISEVFRHLDSRLTRLLPECHFPTVFFRCLVSVCVLPFLHGTVLWRASPWRIPLLSVFYHAESRTFCLPFTRSSPHLHDRAYHGYQSFSGFRLLPQTRRLHLLSLYSPFLVQPFFIERYKREFSYFQFSTAKKPVPFVFVVRMVTFHGGIVRLSMVTLTMGTSIFRFLKLPSSCNSFV